MIELLQSINFHFEAYPVLLRVLFLSFRPYQDTEGQKCPICPCKDQEASFSSRFHAHFGDFVKDMTIIPLPTSELTSPRQNVCRKLYCKPIHRPEAKYFTWFLFKSSLHIV